MKLTTFSRLTLALLTTFVFRPSDATCQDLSGEQIQELRGQVREATLNSEIGSFYGYIISFASVPDISASNLEIDVGDSVENLDVYKVPYHYKIDTGSEAWDLALRVNLNYAVLVDDNAVSISSGTGDSVRSEWQTLSGSAGALVHVPLVHGLALAAGLDLGVARFENEAEYRGTTAQDLVKPIIENILLDWQTNAWIVNSMAGLDYAQVFDRLSVDVRAHFVHTYVDSFDESVGFFGFTANTDALAINSEFAHPLGLTLQELPLFGVLHLDYTTFIGDDSDAVGFSYLGGVGCSLRADLSTNDWYIQSLQLGAKYLTGDNVQGWSLVFGYRF